MEHNLLTALRKYKPTAGRDPLENYITAAYAWILNNHPDFALYYLNKLAAALHYEKELLNPVWQTQVNFRGFFPDMVCNMGNKAFVFEHKAWSKLHHKQLENYRNYAQDNFDDYKLILITGDTSQHDQQPDLALCWRHVHLWITTWLDNCEKNDPQKFIFHSFLRLLEEEGMGPVAPLSHESILYFLHSRNFLKQTKGLINRVYKKEEAIFRKLVDAPDFKYYYRDNYGRIGIELQDSWRPCIFIGIMAEWDDHKVPPILGDNSPDFVVLLSFDYDLHKQYPDDEDYKALAAYLQEEFKGEKDGWQFYQHLKDDTVEHKNDWHPLYLRKPMLDVFRGTSTAEEQETRFMEVAQLLLPYILRSKHFHHLRKKYARPPLPQQADDISSNHEEQITAN